MAKVKITKRSNKTLFVGCSKNSDFVSRVQGFCFPICFPKCFWHSIGIGKIKKLSSTKLKVEKDNTGTYKIKKLNTTKFRVEKSNE